MFDPAVFKIQSLEDRPRKFQSIQINLQSHHVDATSPIIEFDANQINVFWSFVHLFSNILVFNMSSQKYNLGQLNILKNEMLNDILQEFQFNKLDDPDHGAVAILFDSFKILLLSIPKNSYKY